MSEFEALFAFYGLLLGLAVANVTTAFADMYRSRVSTTVGWTVPLLGLVILLAAGQQWISLFRAQGAISLGPIEIFTCLGMALPYIFVSRAMTPTTTDVRSLDQHYADHRITLLTVLTGPILISALFNIMGVAAWSWEVVVGILLYSGVRLALLVVMLLWPRMWVQRAGLTALAAYTVLLMF